MNRPLYIADIATGDKMLSLSLTMKPASGMKAKVMERGKDGVYVFAPVIPANIPIYRRNEVYGEHDVLFLPNVIRDMMHDANKRNIPFDYEHTGKKLDVQVIESFQIDYKANKTYKEYVGLPDGTWVMFLYVPNMVFSMFNPQPTPLQLFGISISGIFSYNKLELNEAIELYNVLKI